jgi:hypothetical protein
MLPEILATARCVNSLQQVLEISAATEQRLLPKGWAIVAPRFSGLRAMLVLRDHTPAEPKLSLKKEGVFSLNRNLLVGVGQLFEEGNANPGSENCRTNNVLHKNGSPPFSGVTDGKFQKFSPARERPNADIFPPGLPGQRSQSSPILTNCLRNSARFHSNTR